jgi:hypothetical protein
MPDDILNLLMAIVIGVVVAKLIDFAVFYWQLRRIANTVERAVKEEVDNTVIRVNIEKHHDCFYLFNQKTGEFVAQGRDIAELKQRCDQRFPQKVVVTDEEELIRWNLKPQTK